MIAAEDPIGYLNYVVCFQTYVGSDIAELLLDGYELDSTLYAVQSQPKANANMTDQQTIDRFRQLVMFGESIYLQQPLGLALNT